MQFTHFTGLKLGPWSKHVSFIKELLVHVKMAALIRLVLLKAGKAPPNREQHCVLGLKLFVEGGGGNDKETFMSKVYQNILSND